MRLLIFLLALMSAFFVSNVSAVQYEPDLSDLRPPKQEGVFCVSAFNSEACSLTYADAEYKACLAYSSEYTLPPDTSDKRYISAKCETGRRTPRLEIYGKTRCPACDDGWGREQVIAVATVSYNNYYEKDGYSCPPTNFPDHTIRVNRETYQENEPPFDCAKEKLPEDCPAGYHSKNVSKALGAGECVPKDCPDIGSGTSLASSKMTGGVPFSGGGMYCNDGCAYSVPESNITSQNYALGVSQGAACGDKPYDNKKLSEKDDGSQCELATNGDVSILTCSDPATPPDGEGPKPDDPIAPVDNDDLKKDATKTPDKPLLDCSPEDVACQIENLKIQAENNTKNLQQDQTDRFNATLDSDTRNTNAIIGSIEAFHTTVLIQGQKTETNALLGRSQIERLIIAVENGGSSTGGGGDGTDTGGGGGGGGGNGGGDGDGDGEPCEGSASDCVPIEDSDLPVAQVNLNQYADQYNDWLPTAELPEKSCVSLTDGTSLCLDFSSIILIFKALSSLLVISALLHSAKIISGAF